MIDPQEVTSPKSRLTGPVEAFINGGADSFSVARFTWDGQPAIGIRWNGGEDTAPGRRDVGAPQSRGLPTWFILPEPISKLVEQNQDAINASLRGRQVKEESSVSPSDMQTRLARVERLLEQLLSQQAGA